jgi:hypothetical protein
MEKALLKQQGLSIELSSGKTTAEPCGSNPYVVCAGTLTIFPVVIQIYFKLNNLV